MKYFYMILGFVMVVAASWPSIVKTYFPYNLPFCAIGGGLFGWYFAKVIWTFRKP